MTKLMCIVSVIKYKSIKSYKRESNTGGGGGGGEPKVVLLPMLS